MDKKYQIFISSTYEDLKEERKEIIETIIAMGDMPAGMEYFVASDDEQFKYIKQVIDNCDYYVLIIGGRYGSVSPKEEKSYTQLEFEYAKSKNIPILVFPRKDIEKLPLEKKDSDLTNITKFIKLATKEKLCSFWSTILDLQKSVMLSLRNQYETNPQVGWQRYENKSDLLEEINIIRKKNDELLNRNKELEDKINESKPIFNDIAELDEEYSIKYKYQEYNYNYYEEYEDHLNISWNEIFSYIAPSLIKPSRYDSFKISIKNLITFKTDRKTFLSIDDNYVQTIQMQLFAHKLIKVYSANSVKAGVSDYTELTDKGLNYLQSIKTVKTTIKTASD